MKKKLFNKLLNKNGSVLFIVLIVMTTLIIVASAAYYAVLSSRSTVVQTFSDLQAYQSALSVSDMISNSVMYKTTSTDTAIKTELDKIRTAASSLDVGKSLIVDEGEIPGYGTYTAEIKKIDDENVVVTTKVTYNEKTVQVTRTIKQETTEGKSSPFPGFTKAFAASGYGTGDVSYNGRGSETDVFYDNEYTTFNTGPADNTFTGNVTAVGYLDIAFANIKSGPNNMPKDLSVCKDLTFYYNTVIDNKGVIRVGGNLLSSGQDLPIQIYPETFTFCRICISALSRLSKLMCI